MRNSHLLFYRPGKFSFLNGKTIEFMRVPAFPRASERPNVQTKVVKPPFLFAGNYILEIKGAEMSTQKRRKFFNTAVSNA